MGSWDEFCTCDATSPVCVIHVGTVASNYDLTPERIGPSRREIHKAACQQAFRRPQRSSGRGRPPVGKWADRPPARPAAARNRARRGR